MTTLNEILSWFKRGARPTQEQFAKTWKSFWHKSEKIPQEQILHLSDTLRMLSMGVRPIGEVADLSALNAISVKQEGDVYAVRNQRDHFGNAYLYRYTDGVWRRTLFTTGGFEALSQQIDAINRVLGGGEHPIDGSTPWGSSVLQQVDENADAIAQQRLKWEAYDKANIRLNYDASEGELLLYTGRTDADGRTPESTAVYLPVANGILPGLMSVQDAVAVGSHTISGILTPSSYSVPENARQLFEGLAHLEFMSVLQTTHVVNMRAMFARCLYLMVAPMMDTCNVTIMTHMFNNCRKLIHVPAMDTAKVTDMGAMFFECISLCSAPAMNTGAVTNMGQMFSGCRSLMAVPDYNMGAVTNTSYMFDRCSSLKRSPYLNTGAVTNAEAMFHNCINLLEIPFMDMSSVQNARYMFKGCAALREVRLYNLQVGISLQDSPMLSKESVLYLFQNAHWGGGNVITLPASLRDKLTQDEVGIAVRKNWNVSFE